MNKQGENEMKRFETVRARIADEYTGVCKLALFFVAGSVGWMEAIALLRNIGDAIVRLVNGLS